MTPALLGNLCAIGALLMFSVNIIVTKLAAAKTSLRLGFLVAVTLNVLVCLLLFGVELALRDTRLQWDGPAFWMFVLSGVFATYLGRWFFFESVVRLGPAKASVYQISSPFFTALIAWALFGQALSRPELAGAAVVVCGLLLVANIRPPPRPAGNDAAGGPKPSSGAMIGVGGAIAYSIAFLLRGAAITRWNEPVLGTLLGACSGTVLHLLTSPDTRHLGRHLRQANRHGVLLFGASGVLTILAQICMIVSLRYIPVSIASLISLSTPALVFPMSYFLLKNEEGISLAPVLGCALTFAGVALILMY